MHGGPDKAVHHYAAEHYAALAEAFPEARAAMTAGALGENLSTFGLTEREVRIGDVFALGPVRLELSQPRRPCWKIDRRFGLEGIAAWVQRHALTGWYYRVLEAGCVRPGDTLMRLESDPHHPTVAELLATLAAHRPASAVLERFVALTPLNAEWRARIRKRLAWLRERG